MFLIYMFNELTHFLYSFWIKLKIKYIYKYIYLYINISLEQGTVVSLATLWLCPWQEI